jgi:hypothetical protein
MRRNVFRVFASIARFVDRILAARIPHRSGMPDYFRS